MACCHVDTYLLGMMYVIHIYIITYRFMACCHVDSSSLHKLLHGRAAVRAISGRNGGISSV